MVASENSDRLLWVELRPDDQAIRGQQETLELLLHSGHWSKWSARTRYV